MTDHEWKLITRIGSDQSVWVCERCGYHAIVSPKGSVDGTMRWNYLIRGDTGEEVPRDCDVSLPRQEGADLVGSTNGSSITRVKSVSPIWHCEGCDSLSKVSERGLRYEANTGDEVPDDCDEAAVRNVQTR